MIIKNYSKTGRSCQVTFELPPEVNAGQAALCGEFTNWDVSALPMRKHRDGRFSVSVSLKPGREYRFRYLLDGERWENDWNADLYIGNEFGTEDSVVKL
jgi:1,4-alpha-glucan branching enzyme